jgi:hypothetical protein
MLVWLDVFVLKMFWDATLRELGERWVEVEVFLCLLGSEKGVWWFGGALDC